MGTPPGALSLARSLVPPSAHDVYRMQRTLRMISTRPPTPVTDSSTFATTRPDSKRAMQSAVGTTHPPASRKTSRNDTAEWDASQSHRMSGTRMEDAMPSVPSLLASLPPGGSLPSVHSALRFSENAGRWECTRRLLFFVQRNHFLKSLQDPSSPGSSFIMSCKWAPIEESSWSKNTLVRTSSLNAPTWTPPGCLYLLPSTLLRSLSRRKVALTHPRRTLLYVPP